MTTSSIVGALHRCVVQAIALASLSCRQTAKLFHVGVSFTIDLLQRWKKREAVEPLAFGGNKTPLLSAHADRVQGQPRGGRT